MLWEATMETAGNVSPVLRCFHIFMYFVKVSKLHLEIKKLLLSEEEKILVFKTFANLSRVKSKEEVYFQSQSTAITGIIFRV